ncbi:MAG: DUF2167 domain-containing protein [Burkholderiales bacterium]|nr:DUF2167 domain-containing protein [Burkholderiales bacterium]
MEAAIRSMKSSQVDGPAEIKLRDQATLKLPAGYIWVPEPAAGEMMRAMGNHPDEREMGLIFPKAEDQNWMIVADYEASGYIKDDDAKDWNVDDLFNSLKEGTEEANKDRASRGFTELEIVGWVEKPTYTATTHRLVWSMSAKDKGAPADAPVGINYNTYALGREGYISLNLLTSLNRVEHDKGAAQTMLSALSFNDGKRYADFTSSTDKVAEYGLAALVGGLAVKKLGFFALAAGLFAKFAKVIVLGGAAVAGLFTKFFKRNKDQA